MIHYKVFLDYDTLLNNKIKSPDVLDAFGRGWVNNPLTKDQMKLNIIAVRSRIIKPLIYRKLSNINLNVCGVFTSKNWFLLDYSFLENANIKCNVIEKHYIGIRPSLNTNIDIYCDDNSDVTKIINSKYPNIITCRFKNIVHILKELEIGNVHNGTQT